MKVVFYTTEMGRCPVLQELNELSRGNKSKILAAIQLLEANGRSLREPHVKYMGQGLWELRVSIQPGTYRVFYFYAEEDELVFLHAFQKKTQKTPLKELDLTRQRMADWNRRMKNG
jgi:phage-related protein